MTVNKQRLCFYFGGKRIKKNTGLQLKSKDQQITEEMEKAEILSFLFLSLFVLVPTNVGRC